MPQRYILAVLAIFAIAYCLTNRPAPAQRALVAQQCVTCRGRCFLGRCFCDNPTCSRDDATCDDDTCWFSEANGVTIVSPDRWARAQQGEGEHWTASKADTNDGWESHGADFALYAPLNGRDLGHFVEIGCGPFTQTTFMRSKIPDARFHSITLVDPLIYKYLQHVDNCNYKDGTLDKTAVTLISAPSEQLRFRHEFDTLLTVNVLEHVRDAFAHLELVYNALKPGGILIFHERWWNTYVPSQEKAANYKQWLYHPVRVRKPVIDHFLSKFAPIHMRLSAPPKETGVYFIGIKK